MNGGGGHRLFHPRPAAANLLGRCPSFPYHELQGHNQQPVCGSWDATSSPVSTAVPSAQNTHSFVGLLIWQDLRLAVPSQKASPDLWGICGASLGDLLQRVSLIMVGVLVCLPGLMGAGISISPVSTLAWVKGSWVRGLGPQLEGLPLPRLS